MNETLKGITQPNIKPPLKSKKYISERIRLDFFNNSNLKTDIQNRISDNIQQDFLNALNDLQGDNKDTNGQSFSEITRLALAYFFSEIFVDEVKDSYYSIESVKGFFDANNLTTYTAIHEIDTPFANLKDAVLFKHCWLIVQSAWFFNSEHFGHHQHIDYINYYIKNSVKLPIDKYQFDREYLQKKYADIDKSKDKKIIVNGYNFVNQWYYGILFLVCKELNLSLKNFTISTIDNREYNPLPKVSRQLRPLTPFKLIECDIKSAFPTFLDLECGSKLKDYVYNNLMLKKGITRSQAKILFNTICNSSKYKTKEETKLFFLECGYNSEQADIILSLTHDPKRKFISFMTEQERHAINSFIVANNLQRGGRLHDAVLFIDDKTPTPILTINPNIDFGYKALNRPIIKQSFRLGNKPLNAYSGCIPKGLNLITKHEDIKPNIIGSYGGFTFYERKFKYIAGAFNMNDTRLYGRYDKDLKRFVLNNNLNEIFMNQCKKMLDVLSYLNTKKITPKQLESILKHIRSNSNYIFNVKGAYLELIKYQPTSKHEVKERDYDARIDFKFKKNIDFLLAMNEARKHINQKRNYKDLIDLIEERIENNDYAFLTENKIIGRNEGYFLPFAIRLKFNVLCTGFKYKPNSRTPLYDVANKGVREIGLSDVELKKEIAKINRSKLKTKKREQLLKKNKGIAHQLYLLLCEVAHTKPKHDIKKDEAIQSELKHQLIQELLNININNEEASNNCFDYIYPPEGENDSMLEKTDLKPTFETDMSNSIFNQISLEEAQAREPLFLKEYLKYHKVVERNQKKYFKQKEKKQFEFSVIDFD